MHTTPAVQGWHVASGFGQEQWVAGQSSVLVLPRQLELHHASEAWRPWVQPGSDP